MHAPDRPETRLSADDSLTPAPAATPASARTAAELAREYQRLFAAKEFDAWGTLWNDDARFVVAYPVAGEPVRMAGRAQIVAAFSGLKTAVGTVGFTNTTIVETRDPDVAVVRTRVGADLLQGGRYENDLVWFVTARGGRLQEVLEYLDPAPYEAFLATLAGNARRP